MTDVISTVFEGTDLSDEAKEKIGTIFFEAVRTGVESQIDEAGLAIDQKFDEITEALLVSETKYDELVESANYHAEFMERLVEWIEQEVIPVAEELDAVKTMIVTALDTLSPDARDKFLKAIANQINMRVGGADLEGSRKNGYSQSVSDGQAAADRNTLKPFGKDVQTTAPSPKNESANVDSRIQKYVNWMNGSRASSQQQALRESAADNGVDPRIQKYMGGVSRVVASARGPK